MLAQRLRLLLSLVAAVPLGALLVLLARAIAPLRWDEAVALGAPLAVLFVAMAQAAVYPCRALPLAGTPLARLVVAHSASAAVVAGIWIVHGTLLARLLEGVPRFADLATRAAPLLPVGALTAFVLYLGAVAVQYSALAVSSVRAAERAALEGTVAARDAELRALRLQVSPHFLFNSLNAVAGLTVGDPGAARAMCFELAEYFRATMRMAGCVVVSLADELDLTRHYLAVERHRFGSRLAAREAIGPDALACELPPLLLQPLVENAVTHGVATRTTATDLSLVAQREGEWLRITISNDQDPAAPRRPGVGVGLSNVRSRLQHHFGRDATLQVRDEALRFTAELRIPARPLAPPRSQG